jgi:hypothetical protein
VLNRKVQLVFGSAVVFLLAAGAVSYRSIVLSMKATDGCSAPDTKTNPSPENQGQGNRPQDISNKNPSRGTDPQHQGQGKPKDEKRRAS